jgi:amino acid adenylation domain-containing protein/non-ribosomal peptide synthase protein (TIGR01720 family)
MSNLTEEINNLSPKKRALLELLLQEKKSNGMAQAIPRRPEKGTAPLSFGQQRLWFLDKWQPGTSAYNICAAYRLQGSLVLPVLERSLTEIVRRHGSLRTVFSEVAGEPLQVIQPANTVSITVINCSVPDAERENIAHQLALEEARRPFDLARGPLFVPVLYEISDTDRLLLLKMHHIVCDGWSLSVLMRELTTIYNSYLRGEASPLPEPPIQYSDFAAWQREQVHNQQFGQQLDYWRQQLAGAATVLELPTDRPRPALQSYSGAHFVCNLPETLAVQLGELSERSGVTLFMTLLAALQTLLTRYTGQKDITVGSIIAGRNRTEVEELLGFFTNTLPVRTDLSGDPTFSELLDRVQKATLDAYSHQDVPFDRLVEELQPDRDLSRPPLFQVSLVLHNASAAELNLSGLEASPVILETEAAKFDLTLEVTEVAHGLQCVFEYSTVLFDETTIRRLSGHFENLLVGVCQDPHRQISELPLLTARENEQLLDTWNHTAAEYPRERCVHQLFEEQAARTPDRIAIICGSEQVTFGELNAKANQLAQYLRQVGIKPDLLVGVMLERSIEVVLATLGVLKAGGAYVPLDPLFPTERLRFMVHDSGIDVLLTQEALLGVVPATEAEIVCLDRDWTRIRQAAKESIVSQAEPQNLAYVIYTSGSTGQPKGVMVEHRQMVNFLWSMRESPGLTANDVLLSVTTLSFDIAALELYLPLIVGAKLVIAQGSDINEPQKLQDLLHRSQATVMQATPATWRMLIEAGWSGSGSLKVLCGGEALGRDLALQLLERCHEVWNMYGPTETTIWSSLRLVEPSLPREGTPTISLGRPISNTQFYVVDEHLKQVPLGVAGELLIGGDGLARGYLNRLELTAQRFISYPFKETKTERVYRTGDLVRRLEDGDIEYLGRLDQQVKIRGHRIETGEIEAVLAEHSTVGQAVVALREDVAGEKRLVAYVVPRTALNSSNGDGHSHNGTGSPSSTADWREHLRARLPEYMIPNAFVVLEVLPLTPNGKVDRRALPKPEQFVSEASCAAPRTPIEEVLAGIWCEVLSLDRVGVHDDFFELGGHSLLVTKLVARVGRMLHVDLPLRTLFECRTVATLAERIEATHRHEQQTQHLSLLPIPRESPLQLSFAQQRLWFLSQLDSDSAVYNISVAIRLSGELNIVALEQSLSELVSRHESLRTTFSATSGDPLQIIAPPQPFQLPIIELSNEMSRDDCEVAAQRLAESLARKPFDLNHGPLLRATLLQLSDQECDLILTTHHVISDGWSTDVLLRELVALYNDFAEQRQPTLPALPIQYADFAHWQRQWMRGEVLEQQLSYWRDRLAGTLPVLELPLDRPRPAVQSFRGAYEPLVVSTELTEDLLALSREEGCTLFMTLFTVFLSLLHRYTRQDDIIIGTPSAGRNRHETEGLIGFFVNTLALRFDLSGEPTFRRLLQQVKEVALGAYTHQDVPFEKLVEELQPGRDLSRTPLYQVVFMMQNTPLEVNQLVGLTATPRWVETGAAKFDLTLSLQREAGGLSGVLEYNADLFDASTISRMVQHYQRILTGVLANPDQPLSQVFLLNDAERDQMIVQWNDTRTDFCLDQTIHGLFETKARLAPENLAVVSSRQSLTYRELNSRANQLARYLREQGVGPDVLVGVLMERTVEMVTALVAILKAGGAYVPLDPQYPEERLAFLIQDAELRVLLTQQSLLGKLPDHPVQTFCVDSDWAKLTALSNENIASEVQANNLAYVIYTSGSTGKPKGVEVEHRSLINLCSWHQRVYEVSPADRATQVASLAFDASVWEMWPYLTAGASVYLPEEDTRGDATRLLHWLAEMGITLTFLPTPLAEVVLSQPLPENLKLRALLTGGDRLHRVTRKLPFRLINHYGPTENTVVATSCDVEIGSVNESGPPIGRPIANTQVYVMDERLQPVPVGVAGELYIGGDSLARGYHKRPELTAERFIPNPFKRVEGGRLYRTGDLVRYLVNGELEFLGRTDDQVKVRGHRIETGEIEATLCEHKSVRESAVVAREDVPGEKRLIAYVVPAEAVEDEALWTTDLRLYLSERLPQYLVPAGFVLIETIPLSPHGKVDRRRLPAPVSPARKTRNETLILPQTQAEKVLAGIWQEVLKLEKVGTHDNFFDLGGDSILSIQITARATQAGLRLTPKQIFQHQTIAELAAVANDGAQFESEQGEITGDVSLTPIQLWFFEQNLPAPHYFNQAVKFQLNRSLDPLALKCSVERLLAHHDALRMRFERTPQGWRQINSSLSYINERGKAEIVRSFDLSSLSLEEQESAIERATAELHASFDLSEPPLMRIGLFELGDRQPGQLLFVIHHLVVDGVSWRIILEDFEKIYEALSNDAAPALPAKTSSFKRWAERLTEFASSAKIQEQVSYWIESTHRYHAMVPVDLLNGPNTEASARNVWAKLSIDETRDLLHAVPKAYRTQINDVLLTALVQAVAPWTGERSLSVDVEGHGREEISKHSDVSRSVGWFTSIFPVHLDLPKTTNPGEALKSIKQQLARIPLRGMGYGLLRYLHDNPGVVNSLKSARSPEISFNYLGQFDQMVTNSSLFTLPKETGEPDSIKGSFSPLNTRPHLIDVLTLVMNDQLLLSLRYSENIHRPETIDRLMQAYLTCLRVLITHCKSPEVGNVTASDFIAAKLSQKDLNKLMSRINRSVPGNTN